MKKQDPLFTIDKELAAAADIAVRDVLKVHKGERVLIATNPEPDVYLISNALYEAALRAGGKPVIVCQPLKTQLDFAEPAVVGAIGSGPDVFISMSAEKLGKDEKAIKEPFVLDGEEYENTFHYLLDGKKSMRAFWSPSITAELFRKTVPIDYQRMERECAAVAAVLDKGEKVTVTNHLGTDFSFSIKGRTAFTDDGNFTAPGKGGNLPAGESFISPVVGSSEGVIIFDGSISVYNGVVVIKEPIAVNVNEGFVTDISGGDEAAELQQTIDKGEETALIFEKEEKIPPGKGAEYKRNARNIGELGIGLNPSAEIVGNMLIDEKAYKTCHIAIGSNYDEDAKALIHLDGLITKPTITVSGGGEGEVVVLDRGELVLPV